MTEVLRIGGACGFWGEAPHATAQLLRAGVDVLVYDYLAEITMSIMARARIKDPQAGFAPDFISAVMAPNLAQIAAGGVKVLSNAGGVNPAACAAALRTRIAEQGLNLSVAVVEGDDLMPRADTFAEMTEMFSGESMPPRDRIASINAYIGAGPVIAALQAGADIVITGRCADSALTLAACAAHFGWPMQDHDLMAAGSLAGHLLECGPQSTGGNFTDWEASGDIAHIGYPIAEVESDGSLTLTKPVGTTGTVTPTSVGEQMLYEIGDPRAYLLPDVSCDFSHVELTQSGADRVRVTGAQGRAPSGRLKVSATWADGFRGGMVLQFNGRDARAKAQAYAQAALDRTRAAMGGDFREVSVECFGGRPGDGPYEEISLKAAVRHDDARAVGLFLRELVGAALATPPGLHFFTGAGRPKPSPVVRLFSFLLDADQLNYAITLDGSNIPFTPEATPPADAALPAAPEPDPVDPDAQPMELRPLEALAVARSGDKGDMANIGVIARHPAYLPWIWAALTPDAVKALFGGDIRGDITRFYLPGSAAMNLLADHALGGGGIASLRSDAQGKGFAQRLLALPVPVPAGLIPNTAPTETR